MVRTDWTVEWLFGKFQFANINLHYAEISQAGLTICLFRILDKETC